MWFALYIKTFVKTCHTCKKWFTFLIIMQHLYYFLHLLYWTYLMHQNNDKDLILSVSKLIDLLLLYLSFAVWLSITYHFFVANLDSSLPKSFNKFMAFCVSFYMIHTAFYKKSRSCFFCFLNDKQHCCFSFKSTNKINLFF